MNLHNEIMNIQVDRQKESQAVMSQDEADLSYRKGHRDARHVAAELSLKAQARIEELEDMLYRLVKENDLAMPNEKYQWMYSPMRADCLKLLEGKQ